MTGPALDAVVLAGGRATRMGGVRKPLLEVGGRTLVRIAVDAARAGGARVAVVGPEWARVDGTRLVREEPAYAGPVAALGAALANDTAPWLLVLAADLPDAERATAILLAAERGADGAVLVDDERPQWLLGVYRTSALRRRMPDPAGREGASMRSLVGGLELARIADEGASADVDTWAAYDRARSEDDRIAP